MREVREISELGVGHLETVRSWLVAAAVHPGAPKLARETPSDQRAPPPNFLTSLISRPLSLFGVAPERG